MAPPVLTAVRALRPPEARPLIALFSRSRAAVLYLATGGIAIAAYFFLPADVQSVLFVVIALSSGVAIAVGARVHLQTNPLPWYLFAAAQIAFGIGDAIFGYYEVVLGREPPFPSIADPIYLAAYPLIALAIFLLVRRLEAVEGHFALLDATTIAVGFGVVQWVFVADPQVEPSTGAVEELALIAYPAMDALLLGALARFFLAPAWRSRAFVYLTASIVLLLMADEVYGAAPDDYVGGDWIDALWLGSYVLWGVAALDPSMRVLTDKSEGDSELSWLRLGLLTGALLAAPTVLAIEVARGNQVEGVLLFVAAAALGFLVLARGLGIDAYVFLTQRTIRLQQDAIRRLTLPILEVRERTLLLPIVGIVDAARARGLSEQLEAELPRRRAEVVVIDVTDAAVDGELVEHLRELSRVAETHRAHAIVAGISPETLDALEAVGIDLTRLHTEPNLQSACGWATV